MSREKDSSFQTTAILGVLIICLYPNGVKSTVPFCIVVRTSSYAPELCEKLKDLFLERIWMRCHAFKHLRTYQAKTQ